MVSSDDFEASYEAIMFGSCWNSGGIVEDEIFFRLLRQIRRKQNSLPASLSQFMVPLLTAQDRE
jgi:hypothetical protein